MRITAESEPGEAGAPAEAEWLPLLDRTGLAMWETFLPSRASRFTPALLELLGYAPGALKPRLDALRALLHPRDALRFDALTIRPPDGRSAPARGECRFRGANGEYRKLLVLTHGDRGDPGADAGVRRLFGIAIDLGQRIDLEALLQDSEQRFRTLFSMLETGVAVMDLSGRWIDANPALTRMLGYEAGQLRGRHFQELTPPDALREELELTQSLLDGERERYRIEKHLIARDGARVPVTVETRPIRDRRNTARLLVSQFLPAEGTPTSGASREAEASDEGGEAPTFATRPGFVEMLGAEVHLAQRADRHLGLIVIGLEGLDRIAARFGPIAESAACSEVVERLKASVRRSDTVTRLDRDSFAVVLRLLERPEQSLRVVETLLEQSRRAIAWRGQALHVEAHLGASLFPLDGRDGEGLLLAASRARFEARERAGEGFRFADAGFDARMVECSERIALLRAALRDDRLRNGYRPLLGIRDGRPLLLAVEPSVRRAEPGLPTLGLAPSRIASGEMLHNVQATASHRAYVDSEALRKRFGAAVPLLFRLERRQLHRENLERSLKSLDDLRCDDSIRAMLSVEERDVASMDETSFQRLIELRQGGLDFAVEGFGAGVSNLSRLSRLNPRWIALATDLAGQRTDPDGDPMLRALIRVVRGIGAGVAWPAGVPLTERDENMPDIDACFDGEAWASD